MSKKLKDTKAGRLLADKLPNIMSIVGDLLPDSGALGIVKNLIDSDDSIPAEDKEMLHLRIKELYELEVADRDSARKREVEISKTKKFDLMFNLTGLTGLGAFLFIVYAIVYLDIPESNKEVWIHLIGICEGIVLSIFGYFFGSAIKNDK
jgi:hypothetical protein|tara:strand:+ start:597 stop:1046 length:450 start_codon:yes stop_codon:yes gene_type:complete